MSDIVYEEFEADIFEKFFPKNIPSEMYPIERLFLNGLIRRHKPKKILEIGVAAGGSSLIILNAIRDIPGAKLYSTDYSSQYHKDKSKKPGFLVPEYAPDLMDRWSLSTGGLISKFIDEIGGDIDFCFLDGAHQNPGEILDYLTVLPYMKPGGIIAIHDITLYAQARPNDEGLNASFFEATGRPHPLTCGLLLAAMKGKKYLPKTLGGRLFLPNIGAVHLEPDAKDHADSAFLLLTLPWVQHMNDQERERIRALFSRHYPADLVAMFDDALAFNKLYRSQLSDFKAAKKTDSPKEPVKAAPAPKKVEPQPSDEKKKDDLNSLDVPIQGPSLADFDNRFLIGREKCPVCDSEFVAPVRYVFHQDLKYRVLLRTCLECHSFWNSPALLTPDYQDKAAISSGNSLDFHLSVVERDTERSKLLFEALKKVTDFSSVLEVGCGIGTLLKEAARQGKKVCGYDVSSAAIKKGKELFNIPLYDEPWSSASTKDGYDLVICIHILDHFMRPLPMVQELATYAKKHKSLLFISLPMLRRQAWPHLRTADPRDETSVLRFCRGRLTHFSPEGLERAFTKYGCKPSFINPSGSWNGLLCDFRDQKKESEPAKPMPASVAKPEPASPPKKEEPELPGNDSPLKAIGRLFKRNK